ncbi:MAG: glycosyltransferase [Marinilabiliales bacterium]|nr:glycosyltransferase [Marinilabiliales bacterium]
MEGKPKRIVLLGTTWPFRPGGIATFNERLARAFMQAGHQVVIYTFSLQYPSFLFPGKNQFSDQPKPADLDIHIRVNSIHPLNWIAVGRELRKMAPDLLIVRFWIPLMAPALGTIARIVRGNGKTRIIALTDNVVPHEKRLGDRFLTRYFVRSVHGFVTLSAKVTEDLRRFVPKAPACFTPHPLYDNFGAAIPRRESLQHLQLDPEFRYLLFFGFIRDYKGLDWLLEAFADPRLRKYKLKLIVAGEYYTSSEKYDQMIADLNLADHLVLHTDFISDEQVPDYFGACDLVVQPYKSATQSGVTQIAYHFEKPILVTNVGGLGEIVPNGKVGYTVSPHPSAIADAIVDFYEHDRYDRFVEEVRQEKSRFSWDKMVDAFDRIDEEVSKNLLI